MPDQTELRLSGTQLMSNPKPEPERLWCIFTNSIPHQHTWRSTHFRGPSISHFKPSPSVLGSGCAICYFSETVVAITLERYTNKPTDNDAYPLPPSAADVMHH